MRVFIAAPIPNEIKHEIKEYLDQVGPHWEGVKWEKHEKLHVTLKFLGEVDESKVEKIEAALKTMLRSHPPFEVGISTFGGFPNLRSPRVLFVGLSDAGEFSRLHEDVDDRLQALGFKKEVRSFLPHITVGRIRATSRSHGSLPVPKYSSFLISEVAIMKSVLHPRGSEYSTLSLFRLGN